MSNPKSDMIKEAKDLILAFKSENPTGSMCGTFHQLQEQQTIQCGFGLFKRAWRELYPATKIATQVETVKHAEVLPEPVQEIITLVSDFEGRIICGDNLEVLATLKSESVDLIYIDPPFFTNKYYEQVWKDGAEIRAFEDRWIKRDNGEYSKDINVFLNYMEPRIREMHRVLKPTGSFYLHCDWHASHYLKVLCDKIFGYDRFINEITWQRNNGSQQGGKRISKYVVATDSILFYTREHGSTWNNPSVESKMKFPLDDNDGKGPYRWKDVNVPKERCEQIYQEDIKSGKKVLSKTGKCYLYKCYQKPMPMNNLWIDIPILGASSKERLGYPTQKPEALLERIISASSNPGDVVLDCFMGGGTTLAVCKHLGRVGIGVDISPTACRTTAERLGVPTKSIEGLPITSEEVANLDGFEWQNWVTREIGATPGKKGADGGIDGFLDKYPIQVKKFKAGRKDHENFVRAMNRLKVQTGFFFATDYTVDFRKEAARTEREEGIKVFCLSLEDVIQGKHKEILKSLNKINILEDDYKDLN